MSFKIASRFRDAAQAINMVPIDKFPRLVGRVFQKLHIKGARLFSEDEENQLKALFGLTSEQLQLILDGCCYTFEQAAFTLTGPEALYSIMLEAGFDEAHAKVLGENVSYSNYIILSNISTQQLNRHMIFVHGTAIFTFYSVIKLLLQTTIIIHSGRLWATEASNYVSKLKGRNLGATTLVDTNFHLNLSMGQSTLSKLQEPTAIFELSLSKDSGAKVGANIGDGVVAKDGGCINENTLEKLCIEFNHEELYSFFNQLEQVQEQIDQMSGGVDA